MQTRTAVARIGLIALTITQGGNLTTLKVHAEPQTAPVKTNGGLIFQSQGGGSPNLFSGYLFAPLAQSKNGSIFFLDLAANLNLGGPLNQQNNVNVGGSSRLGYRWVSGDKRWLYGVNAGIDTRQAYSEYSVQAGIGAEALNRQFEFRANGYIPFANEADKYATGWTNAALVNNQLILDGFNQYVVSLAGVNLETGIPVGRWGKDSLWVYGAYYYLGGNYITGSSGVRGRAELRVGPKLSVGATLSYDNIFALQATGYLRYGSKPIANNLTNTINDAERDLMAIRGLPVQRETDIRMVNAQQNLPNSIAVNPDSGAAWVVRCTGATTTYYSVSCNYGSLGDLLSASSANDVLLAGGNASLNLTGATRRLPAGTQLATSGAAPIVNTQFGPANLNPIFGNTLGARPNISNGVISIGSNTNIQGFNFSNTSITNYSTKNVVIANNNFIGSYTDNPTDLATAQAFGAINVSSNALPAIQLEGLENLLISNNTFTYPQVQAYQSIQGPLLDSSPLPTIYVCNQNDYDKRNVQIGDGNQSGLCLSGNAIRINNSTNVQITANNVTGALDEAMRINNVSGKLLINRNTISEMRMGPDSNIGSAIIVGQNQGSSEVRIENNYIHANSGGVYPVVSALVDGKQTVNPVTSGRLATNVIDPIEIGLCRGSQSFPRGADQYASASFSGNCSSPSVMTATIANNVIDLGKIKQDPTSNVRQDGDGIDLNIGSNAIFKASVYGNHIQSLGNTEKSRGDNGLTFDFRDNSMINISISKNVISHTGDSAIGFSLQNTSLVNAPGYSVINIYDNVYGPENPKYVIVDLANNKGLPVSTFMLYDKNFLPNISSEVNPKDYNPGTSYPDFYLNGALYTGPYAKN